MIRPIIACCVAMLAANPLPAWSHGMAGKRFFPTTLAVEDPFASDELSLPTVFSIREPAAGDHPETRETEIEGEWSKRITPRLAIFFEGEYAFLDPEEGSSRDGFGNLELGLKHQLFTSEAREALFSVSFAANVGGTGSEDVEAEPFSTLLPAVLFGKGMGDLPNAVRMLRPIALTGVVGAAVPLDAETAHAHAGPEPGEAGEEHEIERHPNVLEWGLVIEYSLPYLQSSVEDVGIPWPLERLIPLVELSFETPLDRGEAGQTTGTVNPGVIWFGKYLQLGLEAAIPVNDRTGSDVGIRGQMHFFIDDIFPGSLGRPIFGSRT